MNIFEQLETPKLLLRTLATTDAPALQVLLASNKEHMMPWVPFLAEKEPETVLQKKETIRLWKSEFYADKSYRYGIFSKETKQLVGICFLFTRQGKGILEIGYIVSKEASGKGYATQLSYALAKLSFQELDAEKIVIVCSEGNIASAKVPKKLGFHLESTYKEVIKKADGSREKTMRWAIYKEEFQELNRYEPVHFQKAVGW